MLNVNWIWILLVASPTTLPYPIHGIVRLNHVFVYPSHGLGRLGRGDVRLDMKDWVCKLGICKIRACELGVWVGYEDVCGCVSVYLSV